MCDYSLHGLDTRLAKENETLVVHRFYTGSKGLTSPDYVRPAEQMKKGGLFAIFKEFLKFPVHPRECAVCIPDGAQLTLHGISPAHQSTYGLCPTEPVTFRQLSANAGTYRDAVKFKNGVTLRLQDLDVGLTVQVRALSSEDVEVLGHARAAKIHAV